MRKFWALALLVPALAVLTLFLVIPLANLLVTSFHGYSSTQGITPRWTFENYSRFLFDRFYLDVLARTLRVGLETTALCVLMGYPVALFLQQTRGAARNWLTLLLLSPLLVSMVIRAYGWVIILGRNGPVSLYTEGAIIIGLVHVSLAYMVLPILASLEQIEPSVLRAAANLGASPFTTFRRVTLPLTFPGLLAGCVIVFSLSVSAFVTPSILGGTRVKLLSTYIYDQVVSLLNWPYGSAIGFVLIAVSTISLLIFSRVLRRSHTDVVLG
jgi:putative spermidine/putrescine transport system permease protein